MNEKIKGTVSATTEVECKPCKGTGTIWYMDGRGDADKDICLDCDGKGKRTVTVDLQIKVSDTTTIAPKNAQGVWCTCLKNGQTEGETAYLEYGTCTCGIKKEHVHRIACGHVTQVG